MLTGATSVRAALEPCPGTRATCQKQTHGVTCLSALNQSGHAFSLSLLRGCHQNTGDWVACSRETLQEHKITHVLNCVGFICKEHFKEQLQYKTYYLHGEPEGSGVHVRCNREAWTSRTSRHPSAAKTLETCLECSESVAAGRF